MPNPYLANAHGNSNPARAAYALAYAQETSNLLQLAAIALGQPTNTPQMSPTSFQILMQTIHERVEADLS